MIILELLRDIVLRLMLLAVILWLGACLISWGVDSFITWFICHYRHREQNEKEKFK